MLTPDGDRLADDLDAFVVEHRRCGELDGGVTDGANAQVWFACGGCGARIVRPADPPAESP
jgi:hypothetical protein